LTYICGAICQITHGHSEAGRLIMAAVRPGVWRWKGNVRPEGRRVHEQTAHQSENLLLAALPAADLAVLTRHLKPTLLKQGALLQEQGETVDRVYFPLSGMISLLAVMRQGDAIETATIGREGAVGAISGLGPRRAHTRTVVQVAGSALQVPSARFQSLAQDSEPIRNIIVSYGEMLLIQIQQTAACNALHDVEQRMSRWLLQARDRVNENTIRLTHEFLAQMLGVRRTTVSVVANELQQAGLIRYHRGHIEIIDRHGLEARACECYDVIRREVAQVVAAAQH
jgi:CRP-like cAMP-binding protein